MDFAAVAKFSSVAVLGLFSILSTDAAAAQSTWTPGMEIAGHAVQVETNGVTNTVYFSPGGAARIVSPSGVEAQGQWTAANQMLCLQTGTARECWPYQNAFQAGQPVTLTSDCQVTSLWTPISTQAPIQEVPRSGERG